MHRAPLLITLLVATIVCVTTTTVTAHVTASSESLPSHWDDLVFHSKWHMYQRETISKAEKRFGGDVASASNTSCDSCINTVNLAKIFILNEPNFTIKMVDEMICDKKFANKTSEKKLCYDVVKVVIHLAAKIIKSADGIHWALPQTICADIMHKCTLDCCVTKTVPEQVHLSFANNETVFANNKGAMTASWLTTTMVPGSTVSWIETAALQENTNATWATAPAATTTYTHGGWVGVIYYATMSNLKAGTSYTYFVGSPNASAVSKKYAFNTFPLDIGSPLRPLKTLAVADMGFMNESDATIERMRTAIVDPTSAVDGTVMPSGDVDMVLHYGDIGYADGDENGWDFFGRKLGDIAAVVPYMTTPGNHELLWNFSAYKHRMRMPQPQFGAPSDGMFYQLNVNQIAFLMLDSETFIDTAAFGAPQLAWMTDRLQQLKSSQNFIAVTHHRPLYCTSYPMLDCSHWAGVLRKEAEDLYHQYNVAVVQNGHLHDYERTWPVYKDNCTQTNNLNPQAPIYVTNGAAGNREGQTHFEGLQPWSVFRTQAVGYMMAEFYAEQPKAIGTMNATFYRSGDNTVLDQFVLKKDL